MNPAFPEGELGEIRDQLIAGVEQSRDNPGQLAQVHAANLYFGDDDGRGRPDSKRSIQAIDRATLVAFHSAWYHPNNSVLTISGDFEPKALRAALTKWFGGWKRGEAPKLLARGLPARGPMKIRLVDKPDATQAQIVVVGPGIKHADADLCATRLMNYTLGAGAFSSRLMKVVRSENAKTYGARSKFDTHREPGAFTATTFTREAEAASTIKLVLGEIERMQASGPSAAELVAAKSNMIGGYGLRFETGSDLARSLVIGELDGLPPDHVLKYPACLDAVTLPAVVQAARDHLAPQALVVLGNAKVLAPMLTAAKLAPTETIGYMEPISLAERKAIAEAKAKEQKAAASATPAEVTEGKLLLELALKAKGAESIAKIADLHLNAVGSLTAEGQNMRIGFEGFYAPSRGQREDISMQGQVMSQVLDGAKAFAKVAMTAKDLPADQAAGMKRELWRNGNLVVLNAVAPMAKLRALPQVTVGKQKLDALQVVSPDGDTMRLLFDPQSHQLLRVIWTEDGKEEHQELSDYKAEGGISIARHIVMEGEGHRVELTIDKVQINKGLPKETFAR